MAPGTEHVSPPKVSGGGCASDPPPPPPSPRPKAFEMTPLEHADVDVPRQLAGSEYLSRVPPGIPPVELGRLLPYTCAVSCFRKSKLCTCRTLLSILHGIPGDFMRESTNGRNKSSSSVTLFDASLILIIHRTELYIIQFPAYLPRHEIEIPPSISSH